MTVESGVVHDADHLAAGASGNALGGLLLRFRESEQPQWAHRIAHMLAAKVADKYKLSRDLALRSAVCAMEEFRYPHCTVCNGARELVGPNLRVTCEACGGTGKQRHTDASRRVRIGTYGTRIDAAVADCHSVMSNALAAYLTHAKWRME
jgi:DnaJ-class molecular chaperone